MNNMFEKIIRIPGKTRGGMSIILAGVHGDEGCGVAAVEEILGDLKIENGSVLFGYGNPKAIAGKKRFIDANLNRMFKDNGSLSKSEKESYEYERAQFLKKYLLQAEALLDLHASHTPGSQPFVICESNAIRIVEYLPVDLVVSGFDRIEPGGTDYFMNKVGRIGICVECGFVDDQRTTQLAKEAVIAFLKARGHVPNGIEPRKQSYVQMYDLYKTKTNKFTLVKLFKDFEEVTRDQVIGWDGSREVRAGKDSLILFARNREGEGTEAFLLGERKAVLRRS